MKRNQILTLALTMIVLLQLLPAQQIIPLMQAKAATIPARNDLEARPASSLNPHPLATQPIPTTFPQADKNVFPANYFAPVEDQRDPIPTQLFKEDEFRKLASNKITRDARGREVISIRRRRPFSNKPDDYEQVEVPLHKYVEELNQYEKFLNKLGYTLRDGQLAGSTSRAQSDMGDVLRLRPQSELEAEKRKCKPVDCPPEFFAYDPNPFHFNYTGDLSVLNFERLSINPADIKAFIRAPKVSRSSRSEVTRGVLIPVRAQADSLATTASPSFQRCGGVRVRLVPVGVNPATGAPRVMLMSGFLDDAFGLGKKLLDPDILVNVGLAYLSCEAAKKLGIEISGCPKDEAASAPPTSSEGAERPPITFPNVKTPDDPKCLYSTDGQMLVERTPEFTAYASASDGFGWFNAYGGTIINLKANMVADQTHGQLGINHWGQTTLSVTVLGLNFKLAEYTKEASYDSEANPRFSTPSDKLVAILPILGEVPIADEFHQQIDGPSATFMAGPVPITIESRIELWVGKTTESPNSVQPPLACGESGTGRLELLLGAKAKADVILRGKIDAVVAGVGIEGALTLMDDSFGARLTTDILPDANEIKVTPAVTYDLKHLAGSVRLFTEVDLAVYSKKWSVVVLDNIGGIDPPPKTVPENPFPSTFFAKKKQT